MNMDVPDKNMLAMVGFDHTCQDDYFPKPVTLRYGRDATVWVHNQTGHGILDSEFWHSEDFYESQYREEFSAKSGTKTAPAEHLRIYNELNEKQFCCFSQHLNKETKYLEIGCSFGGILNRVARVVDVCHGVEANKEDVAFLYQQNKKAKIFNTTFEKAELQKDFYDIAVSIEVLEHTFSPRDFLVKCFSVLKPGGILHLEVPNHNDILLSTYKEIGYEKFYYHKAHIHYFTKDSLLEICKKCGFEGHITSFLMYPFFNHVWWSQNHTPQGCAVSALSTPKPADDTPAGNVINEFYRKTELEYERLINDHVLGDCLVFQGRKTYTQPS